MDVVRGRARVDDNHRFIRTVLRELGCVVEDLSDVGRGMSDLLVKTPGGTVLLVEVKNPDQPPSKRRLTPDETKVALRWGASYVVVETEPQARAVAKR